MEVKVSQADGFRFAIPARSHIITSDQPLDNGGEDSGMTPPEFLLASLGSCATYFAVEHLRTRNLAQTGQEVSVTAEKLLQPARLGDFRIHVLSPAQFTPKHRDGLIRAVHGCLVHNTLLSPPEIKIDVTSVGAQ